jgi:hypothetical protein
MKKDFVISRFEVSQDQPCLFVGKHLLMYWMQTTASSQIISIYLYSLANSHICLINNILFSSVRSVEDDYRMLIGIWWEHSQKDANARNNGLPNDFALEDIHTIAAYGRDFARRCIERFRAQTQYVLLQNGKITLTDDGRQHCNTVAE